MGKWYVYALCDPDTEIPFYVGKGTGNRINGHEKALTRYFDGNNATKKRRISEILAQGKQVLKKKIAEFDVEQDAYIYEWGMICLYGESLTNIKSGKGTLLEKQARKRLSQEAKRELVSATNAAQILGVSRKTLLKLVERGDIPAYKIAYAWKFNPLEVERYRDSCKYKPA